MKYSPSLAHFVWLCTPSPEAMPVARQSRFHGMPGIGRRSCTEGGGLEVWW